MTTPTSSMPLVFDAIALSSRAEVPFSLSVAPGETVVVLGDEDVGLGLIGGLALGLERPRTGTVRVFDTIVADLPERERLAFRRRLGYLPAGDGLLQNLSLRDNVALPLRFGSSAATQEIDGRVNVMLAAGRIGKIAGLRPAQANEEERRRAALVRALAFDPALLILEQPFDGLTTRVAGELLTLARGGEMSEGGRRAILLTGQELPLALQQRVERVYRLRRAGALELEPA
jgi:ABC-type transporter Mla maintaining outer membrane lipid asymmetry ATPase subunit MlaF